MSRSITRRLRAPAAAVVGAIGLSGCVTDPAFLEGLAMATDAMAAEMARDCQNHAYAAAYGHGSAYAPSYCGYGQYRPAVPVYVAPVYTPPHDARDRRDRRERRDDRRRDRRRGGK